MLPKLIVLLLQIASFDTDTPKSSVQSEPLFDCEDKVGGGAGSDAVAVVGAAAQKPDDLLIVGDNQLVLTLGLGDLAVCKVVADQFAAFHAEGDKTVAVLPEPDFKGSLNKVCIKCGNRRFLGDWCSGRGGGYGQSSAIGQKDGCAWFNVYGYGGKRGAGYR